MDRSTRARGRARPGLRRGRSEPEDHRNRLAHDQGERAGIPGGPATLSETSFRCSQTHTIRTTSRACPEIGSGFRVGMPEMVTRQDDEILAVRSILPRVFAVT